MPSAGSTCRIEPGKSFALVGASGSGKSTILSLILRLYDPTAGVVRIDGHDLRTLTQLSLRAQIGLVSQDTFLFHDTIFKNIQFGRLDATPEEVYAAAQAAYAHDFVMAQPLGYETIVGDKGCLLSGGQQQRVAIARALLKNAPILLLDEATSALDSESEQQIQIALEHLARGRTVIAIAHRLSTILSADQIVVMEKGRIKEIGTHAELLENPATIAASTTCSSIATRRSRVRKWNCSPKPPPELFSRSVLDRVPALSINSTRRIKQDPGQTILRPNHHLGEIAFRLIERRDRYVDRLRRLVVLKEEWRSATGRKRPQPTGMMDLAQLT